VTSKLSEKAKRFKKAYRLEWRLSNQKEAFVKLLFESLGFGVIPYGLGVIDEKMKRRSGSLPDFKIVDEKGDVIAYLEVTGSNFHKKGEEKYIIFDKIRKFSMLDAPTFFVYLGMKNGKLVEAKYVSLRQTLRYAVNKLYHRYKQTRWGTIEHFIYVPDDAWQSLNDLVQELLRLRVGG